MTIDEAIIHAEEVVERKQREGFFRNTRANTSTVEGSKCYECASEHRQLAEWLKELKELREQTRWIPCSERLPESDDEVLVTDDACGLALVGIDWFDSDGSRWWCSQNVTAWMPLPEPYRGIIRETGAGEMEVADADSD